MGSDFESLRSELNEQLGTLKGQAHSLAYVSTHLAHEVARLRPEYWQAAHTASMSAPSLAILAPDQPRLYSYGLSHASSGQARQRVHQHQPGLHIDLPPPQMQRRGLGGAGAGAGASRPRSLASLPPTHPIAFPHDYVALQRTFTSYDYDLDGTLDVAELRDALNALGLPTSSREAQRVLKRYDEDRSGKLELGEFRALCAELSQFRHGHVSDDVHRSFLHFDRDGNGRIDIGELGAALRSLGVDADALQAKRILERYSHSQGGGSSSEGLEFAEFRRLVAEARAFQRSGRPVEGLGGLGGGADGADDDVLRTFRAFDADASGSIDVSEVRRRRTALGP